MRRLYLYVLFFLLLALAGRQDDARTRPYYDEGHAQVYFKWGSTYEAGIYQVVSGLTPCTPYGLTMWARNHSLDGVLPHARIGLDPQGTQLTPSDDDCAVKAGLPPQTVWSSEQTALFAWDQLLFIPSVWNFYTRPAPVIDATITVEPITSVTQGGNLSVDCTVQNDGNVVHSFGVGAEIKDGDTILADLGQQTVSDVSPGSSKTATFTYSIPVGWTAKDYTLHAVVWSGTPGYSDWLDDDNRTFTVTPALLSLHGRISYHSYSDYMAPPLDSIDGNIFVYTIDGNILQNVTDPLAIDNSMNPHFSPDGSAIIFMAIPSGAARNRNSLEIYLYDLAQAQLTRLTSDSVPDEDPKFSPDGGFIVWKRNGQIWRMQNDGNAKIQLTSTGDEKSGPNYSPDGSYIVYWSNTEQDADIWRISANGSSASVLVANANLQDYYPIYRDNNNVLYSRWESTSDTHDKVYNVELSSGVSTRLAVNITGVEDADAGPIDTTYFLLSSTRSGGKGSYDVFVARYDNGESYSLGNANSVHKDLGACYSPYTYARKLKLRAPTDGTTLTAGASYTIQVQAYSNGGIWSNASPSVTFQGPSPQTYSDLRDDGTAGDASYGDGIYSRTITLPTSPGDYSITVTAQSVEPGITRQVSTSPITVTINPANSAPTNRLVVR